MSFTRRLILCAALIPVGCDTPETTEPYVFAFEGQRCLVEDTAFADLTATVAGSRSLRIRGQLLCTTDTGAEPLAYASVYLSWPGHSRLMSTTTGADGVFNLSRPVYSTQDADGPVRVAVQGLGVEPDWIPIAVTAVP
ncbi:MAG: hypothetical protein AAFV53_19165 [Myxococcota bacterium]